MGGKEEVEIPSPRGAKRRPSARSLTRSRMHDLVPRLSAFTIFHYHHS